ncbi:N-acetylmuramic acid 6-phosphate phosphatase [Pseudoclavibacter triregionum]|nr:N-acetylmuramic acid 6-phosphate phosphatase [Pseudoclavibacter triregionum]
MNAQLPAAVLWDMDGTLVDTEPHWRDAQQALLADHGLPPLTPEQEETLVGADLRAAARAFAEEFGVPLAPRDLIARVGAHVHDLAREGLEWRPGARELLDALAEAGVPCALVTNSLRSLADALVDAHGGEPFAAIVTAEDVERSKPAPDPYLLAAERLGVAPARCVVIEDSRYGVDAGLAAGCAVVAVPHGGLVPEHPDVVRRESLVGLTPAALGELLAELPAHAPQDADADAQPTPAPSAEEAAR